MRDVVLKTLSRAQPRRSLIGVITPRGERVEKRLIRIILRLLDVLRSVLGVRGLLLSDVLRSG